MQLTQEWGITTCSCLKKNCIPYPNGRIPYSNSTVQYGKIKKKIHLVVCESWEDIRGVQQMTKKRLTTCFSSKKVRTCSVKISLSLHWTWVLVSNACCSLARCCQMNRGSEKHLDKCFQGASGTSLCIEKTRTPRPTLIQPMPEALATKTKFLCIRYLMFQIWVHCESIWIGKLTRVHIIRPADEINLLFWQIIIEVSLVIERQHLSKWHSILWNADQDRGEDIEAKGYVMLAAIRSHCEEERLVHDPPSWTRDNTAHMWCSQHKPPWKGARSIRASMSKGH
jgi:hypothetical protein